MTFYCTVVAKHCDMVIMAFLQPDHPIDESKKTSLSGFDSKMRKNVYEGVFLLFLDARARFACEIGVQGIVAKTRYFPVLSHTDVF